MSYSSYPDMDLLCLGSDSTTCWAQSDFSRFFFFFSMCSASFSTESIREYGDWLLMLDWNDLGRTGVFTECHPFPWHSPDLSMSPAPGNTAQSGLRNLWNVKDHQWSLWLEPSISADSWHLLVFQMSSFLPGPSVKGEFTSSLQKIQGSWTNLLPLTYLQRKEAQSPMFLWWTYR